MTKIAATLESTTCPIAQSVPVTPKEAIMARSVRSEIVRWSALLWLAVSTIYLLVLSVLMCADARFPLNLGAIRTTGRTGLWVTLAPAIAGCLAFVLVLLRTRAGAIVLGAYCGFWIAVLACGLPWVWNARETFCTRTLCIRTPWIGRILVFGLMTPFAIVAAWAKHEFARLRQTGLSAENGM
jgi:hypothetical protein